MKYIIRYNTLYSLTSCHNTLSAVYTCRHRCRWCEAVACCSWRSSVAQVWVATGIHQCDSVEGAFVRWTLGQRALASNHTSAQRIWGWNYLSVKPIYSEVIDGVVGGIRYPNPSVLWEINNVGLLSVQFVEKGFKLMSYFLFNPNKDRRDLRGAILPGPHYEERVSDFKKSLIYLIINIYWFVN